MQRIYEQTCVLAAVLIVGVFSIAVSAAQAGGGAGLNATPSVMPSRSRARRQPACCGAARKHRAFVSTKGVGARDTKVSGWGQPLLAKLKTSRQADHHHHQHAQPLRSRHRNAELPSVEIVTHQNHEGVHGAWNPIHGFRRHPQSIQTKRRQGAPHAPVRRPTHAAPAAIRVDLYHYGRAHTGRRRIRCVPGRSRDARR